MRYKFLSSLSPGDTGQLLAYPGDSELVGAAKAHTVRTEVSTHGVQTALPDGLQNGSVLWNGSCEINSKAGRTPCILTGVS